MQSCRELRQETMRQNHKCVRTTTIVALAMFQPNLVMVRPKLEELKAYSRNWLTLTWSSFFGLQISLGNSPLKCNELGGDVFEKL